MTSDIKDSDRPVTAKLHPLIYKTIVGLALWLVISIWAFNGGLYTDYLLVVVSGLIFFATLVPATLWWTRRRHRAGASGVEPFREWEEEDFATWQGQLSGREAALQVLLPIAAVAFGMTIFVIVQHLVL